MECLVLFQLLVMWGSLIQSSQSIASNEISGLEAFKKAIHDDPYSVLANWNTSHGDPCKWNGISCSEDGEHVLSLNISHSSLKGFIAPELGLLTSLQKLILSQNVFQGTIPKKIGMLKNLTVLDLSVNRLSGPIPPEIGGLERVSTINLRSNGLNGNLPSEIGKLTSIVELRLDRNKLHGQIPGSKTTSPTNRTKISPNKVASGLCSLKHLKVGDFSFNFFDGKVPQCLAYLARSSFRGNCFDDKNAMFQRNSQQCSNSEHATNINSSSKDRHKSVEKEDKPHKPKWLMIFEIVVGAVFVVFFASVIATAFAKYHYKFSKVFPRKRIIKMRDQMTLSIDDQMLNHVLRFDRKELEAACEEFSNIIGSFGTTTVYKGTLSNGREIAVVALCISEDNWMCSLEIPFQVEVVNLARINHENTAKMVGYCKEDRPFSRMFVYEYASNGTLCEHLHYGEGCQLLWSRRMKIAIGIARGLKYLHTELQPPFCLSELKSSSVYLTEDFNPKLIDFQSWKIVLNGGDENIHTGAAHSSQDSPDTNHMDIQGNIFAFGVLLLELISGRLPYCKERGNLVDWAMENLEKRDMMCHLVDPELRYFNHDDLQVICNVVCLCLQPDLSKRPSMATLVGMLENGIDTSTAASLKESPVAWAELALLSS